MTDQIPTDDLPDPDHQTPAGVTDGTIDALGKLSAALETAEQARGNLYAFHQLSGSADMKLQDALAALREAGHGAVADRITTEVVGRNVIAGRWTFQVVEDYDDNYWSVFRTAESEAREELVSGRRHLFEARLKENERTRGLSGHEATAADAED
jgi:hypothetical protein